MFRENCSRSVSSIACGAISGFHTLIASGITPKIITRETHARSVGYGAMCLESLVAIMALIAACTLPPGEYLAINSAGTPEATIARVNSSGFTALTADGSAWKNAPITVTKDQMDALAKQMGEKSLFGRTGGAPDRKSTRLNSSHLRLSRMPSSA